MENEDRTRRVTGIQSALAWRGSSRIPGAVSQGRRKGTTKANVTHSCYVSPEYLIADPFQAGVTTGLLSLRIEHPFFELQTPRTDAVWTCWTEVVRYVGRLGGERVPC